MVMKPADARVLWTEINQDATDSLVLYCGAGVTIDRTGVSWNTLVTEVARQTLRSSDRRRNTNFGEECAKFFRSADFSAEHKATVAAAGVNPDVIAKVIADTLYRRSGYRQGRLLDKITQLAVTLACFGKRYISSQLTTIRLLKSPFSKQYRNFHARFDVTLKCASVHSNLAIQSLIGLRSFNTAQLQVLI